MQITIEIPDELAAQVQARGLTPESFVRSLIDNAAIDDTKRVVTLPLPPANPKRDMQAFFRDMAAHSERIPVLPDEAFTRESFYQDHD